MPSLKWLARALISSSLSLVASCQVNQPAPDSRMNVGQVAPARSPPTGPLPEAAGLDAKLFARLAGTHSLSLPAWGPYSKQYIGISHIADSSRGLRFDLTVFPGLYRQKVLVPNVLFESGYHPWEAAADLSYFSFRHELEWKDQVYSDISFTRAGANARLIRAECVNNTASPQSLVLHYMASLHYPDVRPTEVVLPPAAVWLSALDYSAMQFARPRPQDNLTYDGFIRGEVRDNAFVGGSALGKAFGADPGDQASYQFTLLTAHKQSRLLIRYRVKKGALASFQLKGNIQAQVKLSGTGAMALHAVPIGPQPAGQHTFTLISNGPTPVEIDGFALVEEATTGQVAFQPSAENQVPEISKGPTSRSLLLKFPGLNQYYGLAWDSPSVEVRQLFNDELDIFLRKYVHDHVRTELHGNDLGHFTNVFARPIPVPPHTTQTLYGLVCSGTQEEVRHYLQAFETNPKPEETYARARQSIAAALATPAGKTYQFSQQLMRATTLTNLVYPVYTQRTYIKHYPPGRWWNSLYTWDSGFIGLGLAELDVRQAVECLNAYTTAPGHPSAFIHHGSPVPVQIYLFQELWNRTQSKELLAYFYPRLRQYHRFMVGRLGSSTTRTLPSNLLRTWDYFYNSGGWDDYPPQVFVHQQKLEATVTPIINTAHGVRTAKIMRLAALALGQAEDVREYDQDIAVLSAALQTHAWDEQSGYYGYVRHDPAGQPLGILRHSSGANYNMGLDGAYPLLAGICTPSQKERLLSHLRAEKGLWTPIGLSAVDQSAPYYRPDGYWNGSVWMPHQWFFWKTMLDLGEADEAFKIARTGLNLWKNEVETSYNCFEHFLIQTGRGAGWHQFSGLSTPVLSWFGAYYKPGRLTAGFDAWVKDKQFSNDNRHLSATVQFNPGRPTDQRTLLVSMNPTHRYQALLNGQPCAAKLLSAGVLQLAVAGDVTEAKIQVKMSR